MNLPFVSGLEIPAPLALSVFLSSIAVAIYAVRALGRRRRRHERRQSRAFGHLLQQFLDDKVSAADLRRAVDAADPGSYWTAVEALSLHLDRREWLRLSVALERVTHAAEERYTLRSDSPWR